MTQKGDFPGYGRFGINMWKCIYKSRIWKIFQDIVIILDMEIILEMEDNHRTLYFAAIG